MKTLQQHRARPQRWLATLTIALLALGAPLATAAPAFANEAVPVVEAPLAETPAVEVADAAAPADAAAEPVVEAPVEPVVVADAAAPAPDAPADAPQAVQALAAPAPEAAPLLAVAAAPVVTVTDAPRAGGSVTVRGIGFSTTGPGIYLGLGVTGLPGFYLGSGSLVASETTFVAQGNPLGSGAQGKTAPLAADGSFEFTVTVPAFTDAKPSYAIYTSKAHGQGMSDKSQDTTTAVQFAPAPKPTVVVSKTKDVNPKGETVTVTGSGFLPTSETTGTRPPLAGKFTGSYVVFGRFADVWAPSANAPSSARAGSSDVKWAVNAADVATIGGAAAGAIEVKADGTFTATLNVSEEFAKNPGTGNYGIYTYPGGGAKYAPFETFTPITFAPAVQKPTVTVSKTTGLNAKGDTVTVSGSGFLPTAETTGTRPPLAGKFTGSYVVFGRFADVWAPSANAPSSARAGSSDVKWAVNAADMATIGGPAAGAIEVKADGTFTTTLTVSEEFAKNPGSGNYGVYTYPGGGAKYAPFESYTPLSFASAVPTPQVVVSKTTGLNADGDTVTVSGSGFLPTAETTGTRPPLAGKFTGAYVVFGRFADVWAPSANAPASARAGSSDVKWAVNAADMATIGGEKAGAIEVKPDGTFTTTLKVSELFDKNPGSGNYGIYTYPGGGAKYAPFESYTPISFGVTPAPEPTPPVINPPVVAPPAAVQGGSLSWGVSSSFRDYIKDIAQGSIAVSNGATASGGKYNFGQSGGSFNHQSGTGSADYSGTVRFTGHGGVLDLAFANPTVSTSNGSTATLSLSVNGGRVDFATVNLAAASRSTSNGATTYSGAPVTLSGAGAVAFQGFYPAGKPLDPITVTIGANAAAPAGSTGTISTASVKKSAASSIPATPPATEGITLSPAVLAGLTAGGQISFEVDGFQPNETGIRIVIYSTPTVLAENLTADAQGVVRWTGTLPATLTGQHTLTVQGSINKGIVITIPERAVADSCLINGATLDWGFKQSFIAYLTSGIANGTAELSGGTTEADGIFKWTAGTGNIDPKTNAGLVTFAGGIRFTGHSGALDTTVSNPRIELVSPTEGYLVLDVAGTTQQGEPINSQGIRFGVLDLAAGGFASDDKGITGTNIAAALTDAGAAAFGTYPAGEALDPVSFVLPTAADCGVAATEEVEKTDAGASDKKATAVSDTAPAEGISWVVWALIAALAVAVAVIVVLLATRRRAGAGASAE